VLSLLGDGPLTGTVVAFESTIKPIIEVDLDNDEDENV
jgi:hypothetical protein